MRFFFQTAEGYLPWLEFGEIDFKGTIKEKDFTFYVTTSAGGDPFTVVLHYKPAHSVVPGHPDVHAVETDRWVVYPFKAGL